MVSQTIMSAMSGIILETIEEMGEKGAPSGPVYMACMRLLDIDAYNEIIFQLKKAGKIREEHNVLYATKAPPK